MSEKAKTAKAETMNEETAAKAETETVTIPLDPAGTSDSVYLCVNGRSMLVRRGVPVELPAVRRGVAQLAGAGACSETGTAGGGVSGLRELP